MAYDKKDRVSITTNAITFFDENGIMLQTNFLDDSMAISFRPPTEENGKRVWSKDNRESLILTKERVSALYNLIIEKVLPKYKSGENYNGGVFTSMKKDSVFEIVVMNGEIFAMYHREIDESRHPKKSTVFKFGKTPIIEKYSKETGEFVLEEVDALFMLFVKTLEGFMSNAVNGSVAHGMRYGNQYTTDKIFSYLSGMANKLGVTVMSNSYSKPNGAFDAGAAAPTPVIQETDNLEGILAF